MAKFPASRGTGDRSNLTGRAGGSRGGCAGDLSAGAAHVARPLVYQTAGSVTPRGRRHDTNESTMDVRGNRMSGRASEVGRAVDGANTAEGQSA